VLHIDLWLAQLVVPALLLLEFSLARFEQYPLLFMKFQLVI